MNFTRSKPYESLKIGENREGFYRFDKISFNFIDRIMTFNKCDDYHIVYDLWNKWCEAFNKNFNVNAYYRLDDGIYAPVPDNRVLFLDQKDIRVFELNLEINPARRVLDINLNDWKAIGMDNIKLSTEGGRIYFKWREY